MVRCTSNFLSICCFSFSLANSVCLSHSALNIYFSWALIIFSSSSLLFLSSFWIATTAFLSSTFYCCCCFFILYCSSFLRKSLLLSSANNISSKSQQSYIHIDSAEYFAFRQAVCFSHMPISVASDLGLLSSTHQHSVQIFFLTWHLHPPHVSFIFTPSVLRPFSPSWLWSVREFIAYRWFLVCRLHLRLPKVGPIFAYIVYILPSDCKIILWLAT